MTGELAVDGSAARLVSLDDPAVCDPAIAGNKAATLGLLRQAGFHVPPGIVIRAGAAIPLSTEVAERLGPAPWAVRSSSTVEDGEHASFAGQFDTALNVDAGDLVQAVTACFKSADAEKVAAYAGHGKPGAMAVLIQPMVDARAAGVAFTVDPVTGRRNIIIEAVAGLGDALVSGQASPERWVIEDNGSINAPAKAVVLNRGQAQAVAALARQIESHRGSPQDIEWAISGGELWLLQARPITRAPSPIPIDVPSGVWMRDDFHEPIPMSPFARVMLIEQIVKAMPDVYAEFGVLIDHIEVAFIGGWMYARPIPLAMTDREQVERRVHAAEKAIESDLPLTVTRKWFAEWRPEHEADARSALALDLHSLSDAELIAELDHRVEVMGRPAHMTVGIAWFVLMHDLVAICQELLEWDTAKSLTLVEGLSTTSTAPARDVAALVRFALSRPAIMKLLLSIDETTAGKLAGADAGFAEAFSAYVEATGHRAVRFDVVDPNLAERPDLLLRLVAEQMTGRFSPEQVTDQARIRRERATDEAWALLAPRTAADRTRFERALARAREAYPSMEDKTWHTQAVQTALLRYLGLEIGRRLVARSQLREVEDIWYLEVDEARSALSDGADHRDATRLRRAQRAWAIANPGPLVYGDPQPGTPPFHLLPGAARRVNEAMRWGLGEFMRSRPRSIKRGQVAGVPASPGRHTGPVRLVMGEREFDKIRSGDVVVCPTTSPVWSIVFPSLGALVTDAGGILSHPAIIAREHGIPAVVGAGNATRVLRDGQMVTVDGNTGEVEL